MRDRRELHAALGGGGDVARARLAEQGADAHILVDAELAERASDLEGASDAVLGDAVGGHAGDGLALEGDLAGARLEIAGHEVEQRRLPRAIGADDAGDRSRLDGERHVGDRRQAAEVLGQVLDGEDAHDAALRFRSPRTPPGAIRISRTSSRPVAKRWKSSRRPRSTWVMKTSAKAPITGPNSVRMPPRSE